MIHCRCSCTCLWWNVESSQLSWSGPYDVGSTRNSTIPDLNEPYRGRRWRLSLLIRPLDCIVNPSVLFAFLEIRSMWFLQYSDTCRSTPKYFVHSWTLRTFSLSLYGCLMGDLDLMALNTLHFCGWNSMSHLRSISARVWGSCCRVM